MSDEEQNELGRQENIEKSRLINHELGTAMTQLLQDNSVMISNSKIRGEQLEKLATQVSSLTMSIEGKPEHGMKGFATRMGEYEDVQRVHSKQIGAINTKLFGWGMVMTAVGTIILFFKDFFKGI